MAADTATTVRSTRKTPIAVWVAVPVLLVMLAFIGVLATSDPSGTEQAQSPLLGRQAPNIASETVEGEAFDLTEYRGQFVLVNFFATWCVPCVREHPELVNFERRHAAAGDAAVVSVVYDVESSRVRDFFAENGGDWPVVTDPDGRVALEYGVAGVPESYLVGPDGTVMFKLIGGVTATALDQALIQAQELVG